ncbi:uncharacterized protein LOC125686151 [Lagopus muta]|uniref:uncharacterized protein LOC125686151 n=1 Tax=Lagopus muta TaxID=64668 RepID=UPI0020A1EC8E|nr:uncharacterized protein LOC125686151 [Lagopus muta]
MAVRPQLQPVMGRQFLQPADFQALPSSRDDIAWQKKAGKMLLPHGFSLVDAFCRFLSKRRTQESRQLKIAVLQAMSRTKPVHLWNGAGQGGKRKASAEADASGLPLKRSHVESQECGTAPKRDRGAESEGKIDPKAVQEVLSGRARLQAGGLPPSAGPSSGGRPAPAVCPRSVSESLAGCKRKGLEEELQTAQLPACKRARGQSGGSVLAPAAQPGPAAARSPKLTEGKRVEASKVPRQ